MLVQTDWTNIQDPSSFLPEFRSPFTLAPPLLGFRLCSVESVLQCLQSVPQVWIHGASSGPFHKSPQNWSDAEESHGKVSTKTRPKAVDVNQMTGSFVVGNLFPFLCVWGLDWLAPNPREESSSISVLSFKWSWWRRNKVKLISLLEVPFWAILSRKKLDEFGSVEKHLEVGWPKMFRTWWCSKILQAEAEMTHDLIYGFQGPRALILLNLVPKSNPHNLNDRQTRRRWLMLLAEANQRSELGDGLPV